MKNDNDRLGIAVFQDKFCELVGDLQRRMDSEAEDNGMSTLHELEVCGCKSVSGDN